MMNRDTTPTERATRTTPPTLPKTPHHYLRKRPQYPDASTRPDGPASASDASASETAIVRTRRDSSAGPRRRMRTTHVERQGVIRISERPGTIAPGRALHAQLRTQFSAGITRACWLPGPRRLTRRKSWLGHRHPAGGDRRRGRCTTTQSAAQGALVVG